MACMRCLSNSHQIRLNLSVCFAPSCTPMSYPFAPVYVWLYSFDCFTALNPMPALFQPLHC